MLRLKKNYEMVIEARNYTGIVLIDRNDELCILYEKANVQDDILRRGELALKQREDDTRMLRIEVSGGGHETRAPVQWQLYRELCDPWPGDCAGYHCAT